MARVETRAPRRLSGYTADEYLGLVDQGVLGADDRVELLEGLIVVREPQNPSHASGVWRAHRALERAVGDRAIVRGQLDHIAGPRSVPEPDVAVVPPVPDGYASDASGTRPPGTRGRPLVPGVGSSHQVPHLREGQHSPVRHRQPAGRLRRELRRPQPPAPPLPGAHGPGPRGAVPAGYVPRGDDRRG